ncbi:hypothetical protein PBI_SMARTIES_20 [Microbacterium phage Smarties]|uniref:Uncharacterized protein n=1 Tax=Microbacterium phage Ariadne TaxID=2656546 RepID=A0A649VBK6_9CAUD|nr:hypothetical protein QDA10_gp020 [Microbacterium phage Ariadne]QGJ89425.1 hypothetical protein PBI_ARIADNE_20 [Microbacterium phage Ariadne]QGJ91412.1 hypothetical protein PBI_SMARTIES_20 [Microbacterium phage Smarties]
MSVEPGPETEAAALSEQLEDSRPRARRAKPRRPSYRHFGIRFSQWGREYKGYCYSCEYESAYGSRGKAVKSTSAHVTAVHGVNGLEEAR